MVGASERSFEIYSLYSSSSETDLSHKVIYLCLLCLVYSCARDMIMSQKKGTDKPSAHFKGFKVCLIRLNSDKLTLLRLHSPNNTYLFQLKCPDLNIRHARDLHLPSSLT